MQSISHLAISTISTENPHAKSTFYIEMGSIGQLEDVISWPVVDYVRTTTTTTTHRRVYLRNTLNTKKIPSWSPLTGRLNAPDNTDLFSRCVSLIAGTVSRQQAAVLGAANQVSPFCRSSLYCKYETFVSVEWDAIWGRTCWPHEYCHSHDLISILHPILPLRPRASLMVSWDIISILY
jgi:hypothetical protein